MFVDYNIECNIFLNDIVRYVVQNGWMYSAISVIAF